MLDPRLVPTPADEARSEKLLVRNGEVGVFISYKV